jgi:hypothetical protein
MSKYSKLICAGVLSTLTAMKIQTFEDVTPQQWATITADARAKVESGGAEVTSLWRNPDIAAVGGGFRVKKSQTNFPVNINGVPLHPCSRDGQRYCVEFQYSRCEEGKSCRLGLHKCAAVFRSGRVCHGNHSGGECMSKKHARVREEPPGAAQDVTQKKAEKPAARPGAPQSKSMPRKARGVKRDRSPCHVENDSIVKQMLPSLNKKRDKVRGIRTNPEAPRLVAKVCKEIGKGELWLGPLPTAGRMQRITNVKHSIQIHCFKRGPTEVDVQRGEGGELIPGTMPFRCEMSNTRQRLTDMRALMPRVINSLRQGDNAYIHCVSGISRAPVAAAVLASSLMNISFERAKYIISQVRNVDFRGKSEEELQRGWGTILHEAVPTTPSPTGFSCRTSNPDEVVVHATRTVANSLEPICRWKKGAAGRQDFKRNTMTVSTIEEASNQFSGTFCASCFPLLRASLALEVKRYYR